MDVCQDKTVLASTQQHFYGTSRPLPDVAPVRRAGLGLVAPTVVIIAVVWVLGWARVAGLWPQPQVTTQSSLVPTRPLLWPQQGPRFQSSRTMLPRQGPSLTARNAEYLMSPDGSEYLISPDGRQYLKPTKAKVATKEQRAQARTVRKMMRKNTVPYNATLAEFEIHDQRAKDIAADLIQQVAMVFYGDDSSPYYNDRKRTRKPVSRQKQETPDVEEVLPIPLPPDLEGVEILPSRVAFAMYVRGKPWGSMVVVKHMYDFGTSISLDVIIHPEHEQIRHLMLGPKYRSLKLLTTCCNQQLTITYQRPVTTQIAVRPIAEWGKHVGGVWNLLPY
uniref:Uncharacterized protein n=1 Tax=Eutreptiella gymnastica TaxID=73025 RepID=A0A7S4D3G0_9EUGL